MWPFTGKHLLHRKISYNGRTAMDIWLPQKLHQQMKRIIDINSGSCSLLLLLGTYYVTAYETDYKCSSTTWLPSWLHGKATFPSFLVLRKDHVTSPSSWDMSKSNVCHLQGKTFENQYATKMIPLPSTSKHGDLMLRCGGTRWRQPKSLGYLVAKIPYQTNQVLCAQEINSLY